MEQRLRKMPISDGHTLVQTGMEAKGSRRGEDTDVYYYDELNAAGEVVASWDVEDSMSVYPPFGRRIEATRTPRVG
ncbi:hypothetical protein BLX41_14535 [Pseudomonas protegens]|uniref:hypothetical protein n=1 Tax=Pseudomonas protegens TaxID=380021 RepID=UPI000F4CC887|nr:hypothetical protein [Pseudomonas protegens]ROL76565.1 hypothetical protein BLX41_14535 [Pseudomonas protegens]